jgi:formate/nitrite transporter FocA (FNT family)
MATRNEQKQQEVDEGTPRSLDHGESRDAKRRTAPSAAVVYEAIRREGEDELERPPSALAFSALAAGLSMGFSLVAEGLLQTMIPDVPWRPLISKFGYSIGFLIVILGRQQLFTENTLTAMLPLLRRKDRETFLGVARLWAIVLAANMVGALFFAWVVGNTTVFDPGVRANFARIGEHAMQDGFGTTFLGAVFAGWLIALMVWLLPFAETARVGVIIIITYVVGIGGFAHVIAGSVETLYLVVTGAASVGEFLGGYWVPTLLGNVLGGVSLVAAINHAQVVSGEHTVDI